MAGPRFDLRVDEEAPAEDLGRGTDPARSAIEKAINGLRTDGVPVGALRPCEAEARDGTRLGGCVTYSIPQLAGRWGAVFTIDVAASRPALVLSAVGERHPAIKWRPSVYEVAHRRLHR